MKRFLAAAFIVALSLIARADAGSVDRTGADLVNLSRVSGCLTYKARSLAGTVTTVTAAPAVLCGIVVVNTNASTTFVQAFNLASASVALGTSTPDAEVQCATASLCAPAFPTIGLQFPSGLAIAATTAEGGGTGSGAGVEVWVYYLPIALPFP